MIIKTAPLEDVATSLTDGLQLPIFYSSLIDAYTDTASRIDGVLSGMSLSALARYDTYALSPAHLVMTGRRGVSTVLDKGRIVAICRHPNVDGEILIFPEVNEDGRYDLTLELLAELTSDTSVVVRLARFTGSQTEDLVEQCRTMPGCDINIRMVIEDVLDWQFPSYVLDTAAVSELKGGSFEQVRQRLHKVDEDTVLFRAIDLDRDAAQVVSFVNGWASERTDSDEERSNLTGPTLAALELMAWAPLVITGIVVYVQGVLVGYAIWESPLKGLPANILVNCASHKPGVSEWLFVGACRLLATREIPGLNLGGSETIGLDRYKRKFGNPEPIPLHSMLVSRR